MGKCAGSDEFPAFAFSTPDAEVPGVLIMADRRSRLDLGAYGLLIAGLLVALSVFSHDPADPPGAIVYPPHGSAKKKAANQSVKRHLSFVQRFSIFWPRAARFLPEIAQTGS